ncbi:MAG TPA: ABC transporter ATP-binding protein [Bryobacteraceae bacterium]|nr:ABC transporter ATP-binding protein [Bryobacteraceae bacterium]
MLRPLEITGLGKSFGSFTAVRDFNLTIPPGEFVCLLGHSGCGKSTVLSILAGLQQATLGGFCIDGKEVDYPGTDRGVVFQSPSLLPWLTAAENVMLAYAQAHPKGDKQAVLGFMELAGVADVADQLPGELSLGTQQRVAIARALALDPRYLLLDEPFGMLDSLTRFDLQDALLKVVDSTAKTVIMVTHDVDEAIYLADRIVLMTDGPAATVGEIITTPFGRPRDRSILKHPEYRKQRSRIIDFLEHHANQSTVGVREEKRTIHSHAQSEAAVSTART